MTFHRDPVEERDDRSGQYRSCPFSARAAGPGEQHLRPRAARLRRGQPDSGRPFRPLRRAAGNLHAYQSARDMVANLQTALETRGVIDQAKAILMDRHKLTADQAFQALAQMSMKSNRKLRAVAEDLVRTGEQLPGTSSAPDADPSFTHRVASDREPRRLTSSRHGFRGSC